MDRGMRRALRIGAMLLALVLWLLALCALLPGQAARAAGIAPVAKNMELTTYRNVSVCGQLTAVDPEDGIASFRLCSLPEKGTVELKEDGAFIYTPYPDKKGRDSFSFAAADEQGNVSSPAWVTVRICKQSTSVTYADMAGDPAHYAALHLAEAGIFTGCQTAGSYLFCPEETVERGEFLAMCMAVCGAQVPKTVYSTGFFDDGLISAWEKPYVAAAAMAELVGGYTDGDGHQVFRADAPVTLAEAMVMLDNTLEVTDVTASAGMDCPDWACQAAANLSGCGVSTDAADYNAPLTRAQAAQMLSDAMTMAEKRPDGYTPGWMK